MHLSGIYVYPVKSLRGCAVASAEIDPLGLTNDRRFMVVDEQGRFLSQRTLPRMALVETALTHDTLTLSAEGAGAVHVSRLADPKAPRRTVSVWKSEGLIAEDCGDAAASWLASVLSTKCRLVRIGAAYHRPVLKFPPSLAQPPHPVVSFADGYPLLAISKASLADLNDRLVAQGEEPVPMDRFRPNLVVAGCSAYAEDTWERFQIGGVVLHAAGPCARCSVITTDQRTGARHSEPLRTLAQYRRDAVDSTRLNFGQNLIPETRAGTVRVGDPVRLL
jgi:uncharacterized protein YcbX